MCAFVWRALRPRRARRYDQSIGNDFRRGVAAPSGGRREWSPKKSDIKAPARPAGASGGVDSEAWNAWHYGDENGEYSREATFQTRRSVLANETPTNRWFQRRRTRSKEERDEAAALNQIRVEKDSVISRLKARREERRSGRPRADDDEGKCTIS